MEWLWIAIALLVGFAAGEFLGFRQASAAMAPTAQRAFQLNDSLAEHRAASINDRQMLLSVLRRELANYLVYHDPTRFLRLYRTAHIGTVAMMDRKPEDLKDELKALCSKYPDYRNFDMPACRDHVLYNNALSYYSDEDIEQRYVDIVRFQGLRKAFAPSWHQASTTDNDLEHLEQYTRRIKDTQFKARILAVMKQYWANRVDQPSALDWQKKQVIFSMKDFSVSAVPSFGDRQWGIYLKDTDEYGVFSSYTFPEGGRTMERVHRSNATFETIEALEDLRIA